MQVLRTYRLKHCSKQGLNLNFLCVFTGGKITVLAGIIYSHVQHLIALRLYQKITLVVNSFKFNHSFYRSPATYHIAYVFKNYCCPKTVVLESNRPEILLGFYENKTAIFSRDIMLSFNLF